MPGRRGKVSFVLQFTPSAEPEPEPQARKWRGMLREVESGERRTVASFEALADGLAKHGVYLPHEKPDDEKCARCRRAVRAARGPG